MAKIVGVFNTAHSPFAYSDPEGWGEARAARPLREDVPMDDLETNRAKSARVYAGFNALKQKLNEARPDVVVVFGDDQSECFDFSNFPSFAVYVGGEWEGFPPSRGRRLANRGGGNGGAAPAVERRRERLLGHPDLAVGLLTGMMQRGFDPAFCMDMPKPERGIGHAFMNPASSLTDYSIPVVPVLLNCYYAPQPTARRCYQLGQAVRESVEAYPGDLRVALVGSGGLWHTPGAQDAYLDEDFDRAMLGYLEAGDIRGMAQHFDAYQIPEGDRSQDISQRNRGSTGMPSLGGPQGGTRETCNWIAAAGAADGSRFTVVDYVPVYASPVGAGFAYCLQP